MARQVRLPLQRGQQGHEGPARRQGRQPRRDDRHRPARAARLHHHDRGLQLLLGRRATIPRASTAQVERRPRLARAATPARSSATPANPLLLSVRSGARASMPGMMDTILNLGLNDTTVEGVIAATGNARFAYDCYRRFVAMYGDVVLGCKPETEDEPDPFEELLDEMKQSQGRVSSTPTSPPTTSRSSSAAFKARRQGAHRARPSPTTRCEQLWGAITAVFGSLEQRPRHRLPPPVRHPRHAGAPPSTCRPWSSATRATTRAPASLHAQPGHRRERVLRRVPGERPGRGRRRRRAHAAPRHRAQGRLARRVRPAHGRPAARWSASCATCRTSSSRSSTAASSCCRRATASAPAWRRSASPSTWPTRG